MRVFAYNTTYTVREGDQVFGKTCSFKDRPFKKGGHHSVHKGTMLSAIGNKQVVVKHARGGGKEDSELKKNNVARKILHTSCPEDVRSKVVIERLFTTQVDSVSQFTTKKKTDVREDDWVLVQEKVPGVVEQLFDLDSSPTSCPPPLRRLVEQSYRYSRQSYVIGAMKGSVDRDKKSRDVTYYVTSLTLHSVDGRFGENDKGSWGVELYERWAGLSPSTPSLDYHLQPSAPPAELPSEVDQGLHSTRLTGGDSRVPSPYRAPSSKDPNGNTTLAPTTPTTPTTFAIPSTPNPITPTTPMNNNTIWSGLYTNNPATGRIPGRGLFPPAYFSPLVRRDDVNGNRDFTTTTTTTNWGVDCIDGLLPNDLVHQLAYMPEMRAGCTESFLNEQLGHPPLYYEQQQGG